MDLNNLMKLAGAWRSFTSNHPKFPAFLNAVKTRGITENMTVDITVTYPDGQALRSGIRVKQGDLDLLQSLSELY